MSVREFYSKKNLLITGATGFVGLCLLEKILRTITDHGTIYILLRSKKNRTIDERFDDIKKNAIFERLLETKTLEEIFENVQPINGDVSIDGLGLTSIDRQRLVDDVDVIIHSAATLDFGDKLKHTIDCNLLGTRRIVELTKECRHVQVLVHVSSAYVNAYLSKTTEKLYDLEKNPEDFIKLSKILDENELELKLTDLLGRQLNSYTITKQMAEHEIVKLDGIKNYAIIRPSMIVGAWKEPTPGWTISKNGPQGFLMGASKGVVRRLPVATDLIYDYIPVDVVVNTILVGGAVNAQNHTTTPKIYHCTSSTRQPFCWQLVENEINDYLHEYPLKSAVWYPYLKFLPSLKHYYISAFFVHFIPAFFLDLFIRITGGRPILMRLHRNVNASLGRLEKFIFTEWQFDAKNINQLQLAIKNSNELNEFSCDISDLNWTLYFKDLAKGARIYLSRDPLKTINSAKKRDQTLRVVHLIFQCFIFVILWYILAALFGSTLASFTLPIIYYLFNLL